MSTHDLAEISRKIEDIDARTEAFLREPGWERAPILQTFAGNNMYTDVRTSERSFDNQMACIATTLAAKTDWMPFLEPWHGVGVYANLFGCPYDWTVCDYPQTRYAISTPEEARRIEKPDWRSGEICRLVMESIRYFRNRVGDAIPISCTDTQSPIDTATLIWQTDSFFLACYEEPDTVHRLLDMITDVIIEFSLAQLAAIGPNPARPGHNACLTRGRGRSSGIGLSDDLATVVSPRMYEQFCRPYNERIGEALGGVVVHSCGAWHPRMIETIRGTKGLQGVELAFSKDEDPSPSSPEVVRDGFAGTGVLVKARVGHDFLTAVERAYRSDFALVPQIAWDDDPAARDRNYDTLRERLTALAEGGAR
ncbi:MAG: uroporphyrinogen decarboxylase family protein [Spirochaetia bacterium]